MSNKFKQSRVFVVRPTGANHLIDTLFLVCRTTHFNKKLDDVYMNDLYSEVSAQSSESDALDYCRRELGVKNPTVLH